MIKIIQLQFLNWLIQSGDYSLLVINNITDEFFSDYKNEFNFIKEHLDNYGCIPDKTTFLDKFPDFDLVEIHESSDYLIDALFEDKDKRFLASTFNKIRNLLNEGKTEDAMLLYSTASEEAVKARHLDSVDIIQDTSRYDDYLDRVSNYNKYYVKTGFKELDELIGGWERNEELATIVARPGVGKSWVLLKCAVAALEQGLRVGIYSGEMSEKKVGYRFDTIVGHISNYAITKGNDSVQVDYQRYIEGLKDRFKGCLKVLTPSMINGPAGVTALRAFIEKEKLDVLCVDQHSLLEDDRKARTPVEKASNISKDLKNLQVMKHIPIIAVSQQNRESTETGLDVSLVAQSDRIGQDSTVVIFITQNDGIMTLTLAKSRDSETGKKLSYAVDLNKGIWSYLPEQNNALNGKGAEELKEEFGEDVF